MNTFVYIVLTSIFGNVRCVNVINIRKPISLEFQDHTDQNDDAENLPMKIKTKPNLINVDYDTTLNNVDFRASNRELKFTDFILEVAMILKTYDNKLLKEVVTILDDELRIVYNGCKSHELVKLKEYLADQLGQLKDTPADTLRDHLNNMIKILKKDDYRDLAGTVKSVNSYYTGKSDKFIKVLMGLMIKKISPDINLDNIVRRTLRHLFFDQYCHLSDKVQRDLIQTIEHYWKQYVNQKVNKDRSQNKVTFVTPFDDVGRSRKSNKKRRFKTVSVRRQFVTSNKDKSDSYERKQKNKIAKRRFKKREHRPITKNKDDEYNSYGHTTKYYSTKNNELYMSSDEANHDKKQRVLKMQKIRLRSAKDANVLDPELADKIRNKNILDAYLDYNDTNNDDSLVIEYSSESEMKHDKATQPVKILKQPDLDKLQNIRVLAEEINDMILSGENATTKQALRVGESVSEEIDEDINAMRASAKKIDQPESSSDSKSLWWNIPINISDIDNKNKGFVVSMNVRYN